MLCVELPLSNKETTPVQIKIDTPTVKLVFLIIDSKKSNFSILSLLYNI